MKYNFLSGSISINRDAPESWRFMKVLPFWNNPNSSEWGYTLSRPLYHEAIHFWQFLSSGYIANLVAEEWVRLKHFEEKDILLEQSYDISKFEQRGSNPFTPKELMECWARFWDVHTRNPTLVLKEEDIKNNELTSDEFGYSGAIFDTVMLWGKDCEQYAAPYRWLLSHLNHDSFFAVLIFPIIAHAAFGSKDPVEVFCLAVDFARDSDYLREGLKPPKDLIDELKLDDEMINLFVNLQSKNINFQWLNNWTAVIGEAVLPALKQLDQPMFTSGFDVITRGPLRDHPIFSDYLNSLRGLIGFFKTIMALGLFRKNLSTIESSEIFPLIDAAKRDPYIIFGLPGQPLYRQALGELVSPPKIVFKNFTWYALHGGEFDEEFIGRDKSLEKRIRKFRNREIIGKYGLSLTDFD